MNNVLYLQSLDVTFTDSDEGPLSGVNQCPKNGSTSSGSCSTSSNICDVVGLGEHYF